MSALPLTEYRRALLDRLERTASEYTNISPENGAFLHLMVHATGARRVVEVGTSNGYSAIYFGMALETVGGRLVSLEKDPERADLARRYIEEAGLSDVVEVRVGDALELLNALEGEWDMAFLDAEKREYRRYAEAVLPRLRAGGLLLADDTQSLRHLMPDFVEWAYASPDVEACDISIDDGLLLCWKRSE
ncbi:MAG: class I SAM-dependent methyltransferase [Armatimonadetes bacterium]|nr:class I SAM-dependent methyltransferase [Armatimonadota bacterium]